MIINLENKKVLVCGGSQGIGKAVAIQLAASGASVTVVSRNPDNLKPVLAELETVKKSGHRAIAADSSNPAAFIDAISQFGFGYDILVNNTGGPPMGALLNSTGEMLISAFHQHIVSAHLLTQKISEYMKKQGWGRIINIISMSVRTPIDNLGVSNTIRGAMASWAKTLSKELAPNGITVNNILPGNIRTGRLDSIIKINAEKNSKTIAEIESQMISTIPAGRFGNPDEAGWLAAFLASDYAAYITGSSIPVDGGKIPCI